MTALFQNVGRIAEAQDGTTDFLGGQDASKIPSRVPPNSYFAGINISIAKGIPVPRWGLVKRRIAAPTGGFKNVNGVVIPYSELFSEGRFQALIPYSINAIQYLIIIVNGIIFLVNTLTFTSTVITIQGGGNLNENTPRINWSNAGKFLVLFDFPNLPIIFDGVTARRSDPSKFEVPVSTLGAYNQNRLFIANAGNELTAGDPSGNLATPNAPVTFEEVEAPAAAFFGQIFELPTNYLNDINDPITAMTFLQVTDTSTGIGPLLVATSNFIYSFQSQLPRTQWEAGSFGTIFVANAGIGGPRAVTNVNSDIFFLSRDGQLRTASMSRDEQHKWARVPISREVENWLHYFDTTELVSYAALGYFNNKIFVTANPYRVKSINTLRQEILDVAFGGLVVIGLDNLANLGHDGIPAWDGLWTGIRPMDLCNTGSRFFVISKDDEFRNEIYEFDPQRTYDEANGLIRYVQSTLYTREYDFQNPFQNKELHSIDLGVNNVQGDFSIKVKFKPSHGTEFVDWQSFSNKAPWRNCKVPTLCGINGYAPHNFKNLVLGQPYSGAVCDPVGKLKYNNFRRVQLKFEISGKYWELQEYRLKATLTPQREGETVCDSYSDVAICKSCDSINDWKIPEFKSCLPQVT